jgi:hypothetical protein
MDYRKIYETLIDNAKNKILEDVYTEKHHIIPCCLGGNDSPSNLVNLTAREHFIAHQLLVKIYSNNRKLFHAAIMMTVDRYGHRINNRRYEWLKQRYSNYDRSDLIQKSLMTKKKNGTNKLSDETKRKISETKKSQPSELKQKGGRKNKGRKQSIEIRRKLSDAHKGLVDGEKNPQYGKCWITDGTNNKMIKKEDLIPKGWIKGRTCSSLGPRSK